MTPTTYPLPGNPAFSPAIADLKSYLSARQILITAREGFFYAVRQHLRPEQRPDAQMLEDPLWNSPARLVHDEDWVTNATRGYLSILANTFRPFRLAVLQMGKVLRVGVRLPKTIHMMQPQVMARLNATFPGKIPTMILLSNGDALLDWTFDVPDLYDSALTMETAIYAIGTLFESALQATLAKGTS